MHKDESVFPDHDHFEPERWTDPVDFKKLDKHLVAFGKGSRQCLGMPYVFLSLLSPLPPQFSFTCPSTHSSSRSRFADSLMPCFCLVLPTANSTSPWARCFAAATISS